MASFVEPAARQCSRRGSGLQADNRRPCASYRATNLCDIDLTPTPPRTAPAAPEPVRPRRIHYHLIRPPSHSFHNMLGWNRKAVRITLLTHAGQQQVSATEKLCDLAAGRWAKAGK